MSEENQAPSTTEEQAPVEPAATPTPEPVAASPAETPFDWRQELEKADAKELRKLPKIAGLIGSERQRAIADYDRRQQETHSSRQREETEGEMMKLFEENEEYVKQHYPRAHQRYVEMQQERAARELDGVKGKTIQELATSIGRSLQDVPEWKELTEADHEKLARELLGKPDHEVIPLFNRHVIDLVAERRAERKKEEWKAKELAEARKAIRQEVANELLKGSDAPDLKRPIREPSGVNVQAMNDQQLNEFFERHKESLG